MLWCCGVTVCTIFREVSLQIAYSTWLYFGWTGLEDILTLKEKKKSDFA